MLRLSTNAASRSFEARRSARSSRACSQSSACAAHLIVKRDGCMHKLLVSLISISPLLFACGLDEGKRRGMVAANVSAIQGARKLQSLLAHTRKCPNDVEGWTRSSNLDGFRKLAGTERASYRMVLVCEESLEFVISVRYDIDDGTVVTGRETGLLEITDGIYSDSRKLQISPSDDPADVALRVVDGQYPP